MKEGWIVKKLGEVCNTSSGGTPSKSHSEYYDGGTIPWLRSGEISKGNIYETELFITEEGLKKSSAKIFPINTVVIAMYGATVGQVGILKKEMSTNQAVCGIYPNDVFSPDFLAYVLKNKKEKFILLASGGAQPNISQTIINQTYIPVPPLPEQSRIVEELDLLSNIIEKKRQQLSELDNLAQSIFYDMFGDPVTNEKGWEVKTIEEVCLDIIRGPFGSALKKEYFVPKGLDTYKVYEQKHAIQKDVSLGAYYISSDRYQSMMRFTVYENDIIMSCSGTIGEMFIIPHNAEVGIINQALLLFRLSNVVDKTFFMNVMNAVKSSMETRGAGIQNIGSVKYIKQIGVACPPLSLQQLFAQKIETIEKQKALIKQSIAETEELFNSRMDYYFS